jgi:hypothetical protein
MSLAPLHLAVAAALVANVPPGSMPHKILVASCLGPSPGGGVDTTTQTQIDPASCHGRDIVDVKGRLACGPAGSHPPV